MIKYWGISIILFLFLYSCSDEKSVEAALPIADSLLIGSWDILTYHASAMGTQLGEDSTKQDYFKDMDIIPYKGKFQLNLLEDSTFSIHKDTVKMESKTNLGGLEMGDTTLLKEEDSIPFFPDTGRWNLGTTNVLTLKDTSGSSYHFDVQNFILPAMKLHGEYPLYTQGEEEQYQIEARDDINLDLKKN